MAYRFTDTDKWNDAWFLDLKPLAKLLFTYLCDQCDIAGFLELNIKKITFDLGADKQAIEKAMKEIDSRILYSTDSRFIFIRNFIKHQKNLPLKPEIKVRASIIDKLKEKSSFFNLLNFNDFLTLSEPLPKGYSNSNSNNVYNDSIIGGVGEKEINKDWKTDFNIYLDSLREAYVSILEDQEWIAKQERYHPNLNIPLSVEKACTGYWSTEAGWKKKKWSKIQTIDWKQTLTNALDLRMNQVYKSR